MVNTRQATRPAEIEGARCPNLGELAVKPVATAGQQGEADRRVDAACGRAPPHRRPLKAEGGWRQPPGGRTDQQQEVSGSMIVDGPPIMLSN